MYLYLGKWQFNFKIKTKNYYYYDILLLKLISSSVFFNSIITVAPLCVCVACISDFGANECHEQIRK